MFRFTIAQMRSSLGRLLAAAIAVVLGTAFITGSLMGTEVITETAKSAVTVNIGGADIIDAGGAPVSSAKDIAELDGVEAVDIRHELTLSLVAGGANRYVELDDLPTYGDQPPLASGWLPSAAGEVALPQGLAKGLGVAVGDTLQWRAPSGEQEGTLLITGVTKDVLNTDLPQVWSTTETIAQLVPLDPNTIQTFLVHADGSVPVEQLRSDIQAMSEEHYPVTRDEYIADHLEMFIGDAQFFTTFALAFAAVAVIVAGMVITNTFEVLVAQRAHTLALMRCAGATKSQIRRSVLIEALLLGAVASILGVAVGIGLVVVAIELLRDRVFGLAVPGILDLNPIVFVAPVVVGILLTLVSAFGPSRLATKVPPVVALRPQSPPDPRRGSRLRLVLGLVALVFGLVALVAPGLAINVFRDHLGDVEMRIVFLLLIGIVGGLLTVAGVLILSVFVVPHVVRMLGGALAALTPKGSKATVRLATANAVRNPRRTAATTSALVIGVGLVVMMSTGAASARATLMNATQVFYPGDVHVVSFEELTDEAVEVLEDTDGVTTSAPAWTTSLWMEAQHEQFNSVAVADSAKLNAVFPAAGVPTDFEGVLMSKQEFAFLGEPATVTVTQGEQYTNPTSFPVRVVDGERALSAMLPESVAKEHFTLSKPDAYFLDVDDARAEEVVNELQSKLAQADPNASIQAVVLERAKVNQVIDALLAAVLGLLGVAVIIALVGVANTLSLSVLERRREHGTLRAVGVTQPQLRQMLMTEGILIALAGIGVGIVLGIVTGLAGASIILGTAPGFVPALDWRVILGCIVVAIISGAIASVIPARGATKVPVVVALAS